MRTILFWRLYFRRDTFWAPSVDAIVHHQLVLPILAHEIIPEKSSYKTNSEKGRVVLFLRKKDPCLIWPQVCSDKAQSKSMANEATGI